MKLSELSALIRKCFRLIEGWESVANDFPESLRLERERLFEVGRELRFEAQAVAKTLSQETHQVESSGTGRISRDRKVQLLKTFPGFQTLSVELLNDLASEMYEKRPEKGELVVRKGFVGTELYFVHSGKVAVLDDESHPDGPQTVSTLGPDQFFGEFGLLLKVPRTASVRSDSQDTVLLILTASQLTSVVKNTVFEDGVHLALAELEKWWRMMDYKIGRTPDFGNEFFTDLARQRLQQLSIFQKTGSEFIAALSREVELVVYPENHVIFKAGDDSNGLFFILKGTVQVRGPPSDSSDSKSSVSYGELTEDMFFGELGVLFHQQRSATVITLTPTKLFVLERTKVQSLLEKNKAIADQIYTIAMRRKFKTTSSTNVTTDCADKDVAPTEPTGSPAASDSFQKKSGQETVESVNSELELELQYVTRSHIFESAPMEVKQRVARLLRRRVVPSGTKIFSYGDDSTFMFFVGQGEVHVFNSANELVFQARGPDVYFGEVGLLHSLKRTATIESVTECVIYALEAADFRDMLVIWPDLAVEVEKKAQSRLQDYLMRDVLA